MPRKHRSGMQRRTVNEMALKLFLRSGWDFLHLLPELVHEAEDGAHVMVDEPFFRQAWHELREQVLEDDRAHHGLFHRPWAFWRYEAKTERPNEYKADGCTYDRDAHGRWLRAHPQFLTPEEKLADEAKRLQSNGHAKEHE